MVAGLSDISGFFKELGISGAGCLCIFYGANFIEKGFLLGAEEVAKLALGIYSPIGFVVGGALLVGAGVWLAHIALTKESRTAK